MGLQPGLVSGRRRQAGDEPVRFDAPEYVHDWQATGRYPAVHDRITAAVREEVDPSEGVLLDLCSSTGLLGRRLHEHGYSVVAVQEPGPAVTLGRDAGVYDAVPLLETRIQPDTLPDLADWIHTHQVSTVVARRCFPELWDMFSDAFHHLADTFADSGVQRIILEGRAVSVRSKHPLATAQREATALAPSWTTERVTGPIAILVPGR